MAEPIIKMTRGVPKTDREWMELFSKITKHLKVEGDRLVISPEVDLPPSAGTSVLGRAVSSPGAPADIVAGSDGTFLKRAGSALSFTTITDGDIPANIARDSEVATAISNHEGASDPHPVYTTGVEVTTAISGAITTHEGAADPHPIYAREGSTTVITGAWSFTLPPVMPGYTVATVPSAATYAP